jgi:hypothetical protein
MVQTPDDSRETMWRLQRIEHGNRAQPVPSPVHSGLVSQTQWLLLFLFGRPGERLPPGFHGTLGHSEDGDHSIWFV